VDSLFQLLDVLFDGKFFHGDKQNLVSDLNFDVADARAWCARSEVLGPLITLLPDAFEGRHEFRTI